MGKEGRKVRTTQAMTSVPRTETTAHTSSCPRNPALYLFPPQLSGFQRLLEETIKPFGNFSLSSNYTVRLQPLNVSPPQSSLWAAVCFKGNQNGEKDPCSHKHLPALIKKRFIVDLICPLHGYHGRRLGSALLGGNASCWHQRNRMEELTCAGHRGCIIVGSEKASVAGARRGSFPD